MEISPSGRPRLGLLPTLRTLESLRPATLLKIAAAGCVIPKPFHKLLVRTRIVASGLGTHSVVHARGRYSLWSLASNGYPLNRNWFGVRLSFCRVGWGLPMLRPMFVFSVCRLVSRRCHDISAIHQLRPSPSQNRTSRFPTSGSSLKHSAVG